MSVNKQPLLTGSCLCGAVSLTMQPDRQVVACHCTQCRKQTGHFVAATRTLNDHLSVHGEEHLTWYASSDDAERGFCKHCGSLLFWRQRNTAQTSVMAGCLDTPTHLTLDCHIYVDDKGDYYDINPDETRFAQSDP